MTGEPNWLAVLPPLLAIIAALALRRVLSALLFGVLSAALVVTGFQPLSGALRAGRYVVDAGLEAGHQWILAFAILLGGLMRVLRASGGSLGMAHRVTRVATTRRGGQLTAWVLGLLFFFDDYANTLFVGSSMRPVARRLRISAEKLAFIVDATAAPVASLAPISSWIAVEIGYIADQLESLGIEGDAYAYFLATVPARFYPIFMLGLGLMIAFSGRDFGPMAQAEAAALTRTDVGEAARGDALEEGRDAPQASWLLAAVPLSLVLFAVLAGLYVTGRSGAEEAGLSLTAANILTNASSSKAMVIASLVGGVAAIAMAALTGQTRLRDGLSAWLRGGVAMAPVMGVLLLAWALGAACRDLQTARYLVQLLGSGFEPGLLPAAVFVVSALVSFATGTSWGTMGIVFPLAVPLCHQLAPADQTMLIGTLASVLAGSVFGDHCSPISDTTIMSALAADCDQVAHVRTQLPYALLTAAVALVCGSLPVGLGWWSVWVSLPLGGTVLYGVLWLLSSRPTTVPDRRS